MDDIDGLDLVEGGIDQLLSVTTTTLNELQDVDRQLAVLTTAVHNFVMQTIQQVDGNSDVASVNQVLANALIQVDEFVKNRPAVIMQSRQQLLAKQDAFEQVRLVLNEARELSAAASEVEPDNPPAPPPPEEDLVEKKRELLDRFDENGKYIKKIRKIGERPESLKTIRNIEAQLASRKNPEEDI